LWQVVILTNDKYCWIKFYFIRIKVVSQNPLNTVNSALMVKASALDHPTPEKIDHPWPELNA